VLCHNLRCFVWLNDVISGRRLKFKLMGWFRCVGSVVKCRHDTYFFGEMDVIVVEIRIRLNH
jgi:hypothetical protein